MSKQKYSCVGINYEGGKIIKHILESKYCVAYANIQIAMDAPYDGRVADEKLRDKGRSELQFDPKYKYSDVLVQYKLYMVLNYIQEKYPDTKIIIQIARGRSGISMYNEVIKPILPPFELTNSNGNENPKKIKIVYGYRANDYFKYSSIKSNFVFINIGMFAVLTNVDTIPVGTVCNPVMTYDVNDISMNVTEKHIFNDNKNILNAFFDVPKIILCGIADNMPFITPDVYSKRKINNLLKKISNNK
jgi:hypothetical protein